MRAQAAWVLCAAVLLSAGIAGAAGPDSSLRPVLRAVAAVEEAAPRIRPPAGRPVAENTLPEQRPAEEISPAQIQTERSPAPGIAAAGAGIAEQDTGPEDTVTRASAGMSLSLRPILRSNALEQKAMAKRREQRRGSVCGDIAIQGEEVGFVPGRISGCGIENAVRITSVSGLSLSQSAVIDCPTARALRTWIDKSAKPAFRNTGGGLKQLRVAAHYACRTRNNQKGARISEHGRGRAIDISGFTMRDGTLVSVLHGWNARGTSRALRKAHKGACGPFGTVLGPESDSFHRDHFHFDTARYRSGPYCR